MFTARIKHLRITPRKMRVLCNEIRGKDVSHAINFLMYNRRHAARPLLKLVKSAVANADVKGSADVDRLFIRELLCDQGTPLKRSLPRAKGMATPILKRSCHVKVVLAEK